MSFTSEVKNEALSIFNIEMDLYELTAIINYCAELQEKNLVITTENILLITKTIKLFERIFDIKLDIMSENSKHYKLIISRPIDIKKFFLAIPKKQCHINNTDNFSLHIFQNVMSKRAYLRGAFLCAGYISDPNKNYHMEFVNHSIEQARNLQNLLLTLNVEAKIIEKKENFILYVKDGEQISELLNIMETHKSMINFENIRILKDVRNNVNRIVNCETANINKVVCAGVTQLNNIEYIKSEIGLDELPKQLKEVALLRIENPNASLQEISQLTEPHIGKSGVNHRLKKLNNLADTLRRQKK